MTCEHENFDAHVAVNRLEDVHKFAADITIKCLDCGLSFRFLGLPVGLNLDGATISVDGTELRIAIEPALVLASQIGRWHHE